MAKKIQCPFCEDRYVSLVALQEHIEEDHIEDIPKDFTVNQYLYYLKTGNSGSKCIICKKPTEWNESTNKYNRLCGSEKCKAQYREMFKSRMIGKYGKTTLLNDPEQQRKMLEHRKISGKYIWSDNTEKTYTGSYELDFLKILDLFFNWDSSDVMTPSPHTYYYEYEGERKFYIPDVYIPSLNLEIEIKESDNNHPHMQVDRKKENLKDKMMDSQKNIDYIKIVDKKYDGFFAYLAKRKEEFLNNNVRFRDSNVVLNESIEVLENLCNNYNKIISQPLDVVMENMKELIYNSSEPITEANKFITESDTYFDFDKFINGDSNILLVTGLSGSGKTTLGLELSDKYNANYISLDLFNYNFITGVLNNQIPKPNEFTNIMKKYLLTKQKQFVYKNGVGEYAIKHFNYFEVFWDFFVYLLKHLDNKKKYIIDGIHIYSMNFDIVKDYPIIIKETSSLDSMKRMLSRDYDTLGQLIKSELVDHRLDIFKWYHSQNKKLNEFVRKLTEYKNEKNNRREYKKDVYPVYILLMHSGTTLSTAIQKVTHDEFSHSSISFDSSLNSMYSFGRKFANNPLSAGFTRENIDDAFFKRPIPYALYVVFVTKDEFAKMKKNLYEFVQNKDDLGYNFQGLIKYVMGVNPETKDKYFCSEFVSTILNTDTMRTKDRAAMTKPMDLTRLDNCHLIQKGLLTEYDKNDVDKKVSKLLKRK